MNYKRNLFVLISSIMLFSCAYAAEFSSGGPATHAGQSTYICKTFTATETTFTCKMNETNGWVKINKADVANFWNFLEWWSGPFGGVKFDIVVIEVTNGMDLYIKSNSDAIHMPSGLSTYTPANTEFNLVLKRGTTGHTRLYREGISQVELKDLDNFTIDSEETTWGAGVDIGADTPFIVDSLSGDLVVKNRSFISAKFQGPSRLFQANNIEIEDSYVWATGTLKTVNDMRITGDAVRNSWNCDYFLLRRRGSENFSLDIGRDLIIQDGIVCYPKNDPIIVGRDLKITTPNYGGGIHTNDDSTAPAYQIGGNLEITGGRIERATNINVAGNAILKGDADYRGWDAWLLYAIQNGITVGGNFSLGGLAADDSAAIHYLGGALNVTGDISVQAGSPQWSRIHGWTTYGGITAINARNLTLLRAELQYVRGNVTLSDSMNFNSSYMWCDAASYNCTLKAQNNIDISGVRTYSIANFRKIAVNNGALRMTSNADIVYMNRGCAATDRGISVNGTAGTDSLSMTNSRIHFTDGCFAPIVVSNGNMIVTGRYIASGDFAIHWPKSVRVENGNLTLKRGAEAGRPYSIAGQRYGKIYASGDITFENVTVDGQGEGITAIESALGNITVNNAVLQTIQGPIKALNGRVSFTGTDITDNLLTSNSIAGIYAKEFFVTNAILHEITFDQSDAAYQDPAKFGAIEVTGLMKLTNAELPRSHELREVHHDEYADVAWGQGIRWLHAGVLEMDNSILWSGGDIILQDYGKIVNSRIYIDDVESFDDPVNSLRKIEIVFPQTQAYGFYMEGTKDNYGIRDDWAGPLAEPLTIVNKGDSMHGMTFKNTKIHNTGQALTIETCALNVQGTFETFSTGGTLITGNSGDTGKINATTTLAWSQHNCGAPQGMSCVITPSPANQSDGTAFSSTINISYAGAVPNGTIARVNCDNGQPLKTATINNLTASAACDYTAVVSSNVYNVVASTTSPITQCSSTIFHNFGGAITVVPTILYLSVYVTDMSGVPINGTFTIDDLGLGTGETCTAVVFPKTYNIVNGAIQDTISCDNVRVGTAHIANVTIVSSSDGATDTIAVDYKT